jgi:peptidoglycan hydrolase-like protein with peptidoglycan-binding domain
MPVGRRPVAAPPPTETAAPESNNGLPGFLVHQGLPGAPLMAATAPSATRRQEHPAASQGREVSAFDGAVAAALPALPRSDLQPGDRGRNVVALQQHLLALGATDREGRPLQADGRYGQNTQDAVERFQLWTGRHLSGVADKDTLQALAAHSRFAASQREHGVGPGRHLADNLAPSAASASFAAELRSPSVDDISRARQLGPFSRPDHPQHGLYSELRSALPHFTSELRLSQFTAALHVDGVRPGDLKAIDVSAERAQFTTRWGTSTSVDLASGRPPPIEQSLQKVESHNQEQAQAAQREQADRQAQTQAMQH